MRFLLVVAVIGFSANAYAQNAPKVGNKTAGSGKAERGDRLQTRWNGPGHKAMGW